MNINPHMKCGEKYLSLGFKESLIYIEIVVGKQSK